ncbi:hypothetical protein H0H93_004868, partial [Arthromyces matolae]
FREPSVQGQYLTQYETNQTGPIGTSGNTFIYFGRLPHNSSAFEISADPSSGHNSPHYEFFFLNAAYVNEPTGNYFSCIVINVSPTSRGNVTLQSSNPFDAPLIDAALLSSQYDRVALHEATKQALQFVEAPAWKDYIVSGDLGLQNVTTDAELDQYILGVSTVSWHGVGTASMSPKGAKYGVVDPDLRVKGASGLRVVDASVLPYVPAGHPQAAVYIVAERAADLIKAYWT